MVRLRLHHSTSLVAACAAVLIAALSFAPDAARTVIPVACATAAQPFSFPAPRGAGPALNVPSPLAADGAGFRQAQEEGNKAAGEYRIAYDRDRAAYRSTNPRQKLWVTYAADGFSSGSCDDRNGGWSLDLRLEGIGRGEEMMTPALTADPSRDPRISVAGERMGVQHDGFRIDYTSSMEGVRQDFIVERRPAGSKALRVHLRAGGDLRPAVSGEDEAVFMRGEGEHQERVAYYRGLKAWDADGRELAAHMEASGNLLALVVDDRDAEYPVTVDPTLSDAKWLPPGSINKAGDVNNDGYDDLLVERDSTTFLYYGSATGVDTVPAWTARGSVPGVYFMGETNGIGDANNDGYDDVMMAGFSRRGSILDYGMYAFYGSATGLGAAPNWISYRYLSTIEPAGDINGDGYDDVIIGLSIYHGSASGLPATANMTISNPAGISTSSVAGAGDVNGDGYGDVIIGAEYYRSGLRWEEGVVYIFYGTAAGLNATHGWMLKGNISYGRFGASVDGAGDINGDGYDDVIAGLPGQFGTTDRGRAYVFFGSENGPPVNPTWTLSARPGVDGDTFGEKVAGVGDINADGYDDVVVGAMDYYHRDFTGGYGEVFIYYGGPAGGNPGWDYISGNPANDKLGFDVAAAGDINGDGAADFLARGQTTKTFLFTGTPAEASRTLTGTVVDRLDIPIDRATVRLDGNPAYSYFTGATGRFIFPGPLSPGHHTLTVTATGYQTVTLDLTMPDGDKHVVIGLNPSNVPPPPPPFTVCGTVTSANGDGPVLSGVTVEILQSGSIVHTTSTDMDGEFCAAPLAAGNYQVRYSKAGYQTQTTDLLLDRNRQIVASLIPANLE